MMHVRRADWDVRLAEIGSRGGNLDAVGVVLRERLVSDFAVICARDGEVA
jgi:hypothetical protein